MSSFADLIRSRAEKVCCNVRRGREPPPLPNQLTFARETGRLVAQAINCAAHVTAFPPILLSCAMELHACSDEKVIVRVPTWGNIGYNDRRIMKHPLKHKAMAWMKNQDDSKDHNLALELMTGDSLDWRAMMQEKVGDGGVLEHASRDGKTKRSSAVLSAEERVALDITGGKRMRMGNADAFSVNTPAADAGVVGVRSRSVLPPGSAGRVDGGRPSLETDRMVGAVKVEQIDGFADNPLGPCTPCKTRATRCITVWSTKTGKPLQSCGECTKKRKKCFYGDEPPAIPRGRSRTKSGVRSRVPSKPETRPAASRSLEPRRGRARATTSRASSRRRSMTRAPMPSAKPSCYVLLPHLHNVQREAIHRRMTKLEQGVDAVTGALASLLRQHQALAREVASQQTLTPIEMAVVCGAASNPIACNSPPATQFSSADLTQPGQLQGETALPPPEMLLPQLSTSPADSITTTVLLHEPGNEDPFMIPPHQIGSASLNDPLLPDGQEIGPVHSHDRAEAVAMAGLEICEVDGKLEVVGEPGSKALIPGSAQVDDLRAEKNI
ncbi:hypothetical protein BDR05DRAFT_1005490 [Suillus weaverae]|nr:hypothetical protein BDR05DRAFT_1005490 [Suillus weaverae]